MVVDELVEWILWKHSLGVFGSFRECGLSDLVGIASFAKSFTIML